MNISEELKKQLEFWQHYSMMNECGQDDISEEKDEMLKSLSMLIDKTKDS